MSLFGSLFTGVSALSAQGQSTAIVSNNIANVNTTGFKRSEAAFFSLVTTQGRSSRYSPGTVAVNRIQRVDQQGPIQQTSSATDASISGNGLFAVKRDANNPDQEFLYTRNGSFSENAQGFLTNTAGFFLYGWPLDANGNLPSSQGDLSSLVPVDVAFLGGLTRPTSSAELSINLDANQDPYNTHLLAPASTLPVPVTQPAHFSRGLRVFDSLGSAQDLSIEFRKNIGPEAHATSGAFGLENGDLLVGQLTGIAPGDQFSITVGAAAAQTFTITATTTVLQLVQQINAYNGGNSIEARLNSEGRLIFTAKNPTENITFANVTGTPVTAPNTLSLVADPDADGTPLTYEPEAPLLPPYAGTTYPQQGDFPAFDNIAQPNTQGWWEVIVKDPSGVALTSGLINFRPDGTINAAPDSLNEIGINLQDIDWGNGSAPQDIKVDISRFSQFAGNYNVIFSDQNGAELGLRSGIEIDRDGFVIARFTNGASAELYKLPIVTFANANGLTEVSGTAYSKNDLSGEENLREAGRGGAGFLESSTTESSNVDLADEFSKLIVGQRAFSAGTKVITTVDQMTQELLNLR